MKLVVDMSTCIGSGMCTNVAPEAFQFDDAGNLTVLIHDVPPELEQRVREAATSCPVLAIELQAS